jgi:hypothetical protein
MTTIANRVIDFLSNLHGMDQLRTGSEERRGAAIDLRSATIYEANPEFPDGERLSAGLESSQKVLVSTHQLVEHLLVRHAEAMAVSEGGTVRANYRHISDHFLRKTGFGE